MVLSLQVIEKWELVELRKCYEVKIKSLNTTTYRRKTIEWE